MVSLPELNLSSLVKHTILVLLSNHCEMKTQAVLLVRQYLISLEAVNYCSILRLVLVFWVAILEQELMSALVSDALALLLLPMSLEITSFHGSVILEDEEVRLTVCLVSTYLTKYVNYLSFLVLNSTHLNSSILVENYSHWTHSTNCLLTGLESGYEIIS